MKTVSQIISEDKELFALVGPKPAAAEKKRAAIRKKDLPRNYPQEEMAAQATLFDAMVDYRSQRNTGVPVQLVQIAQALILCGLPYRTTESREHTRVSRAADGSMIRVRFHAMGKDENDNPIPMAFGSDRTFLHWCIDKAIKLKSPFVPLSTPQEFMKDVGQLPTGPNYARLRASYQRISSLAIVVERFGKGVDGDETRSIMPIIAHSHLSKTIAPNGASLNGPAGIRFGDDFFREVNRHHVPFPWDILRTLDKKPQMQDYILFLHWRSFAAKTETLIPWDLLREQLWQDDSNPRRIRFRLAEAAKVLKVAWPELNAVAEKRGLRIGPPRKGQHLIPAFAGETKLLNR